MPAKKYFEMDRVDCAIANFASIENPTRADLNRVLTVAQVECELDIYRIEAWGISRDELEAEAHDSQRLGRHMELANDPRPHELCDAHAIVSGAHKEAAGLRAVIAWFKLRIDDPCNGCWLPRSTAAVSQMPTRLRNAVPHSRIHRKKYYRWLERLIDLDIVEDLSDLRNTLRQVETRLQNGSIRPQIMEPA